MEAEGRTRSGANRSSSRRGPRSDWRSSNQSGGTNSSANQYSSSDEECDVRSSGRGYRASQRTGESGVNVRGGHLCCCCWPEGVLCCRGPLRSPGVSPRWWCGVPSWYSVWCCFDSTLREVKQRKIMQWCSAVVMEGSRGALQGQKECGNTR